MAESILGVATEIVFGKAISLASEEITRIWRVNKDLQTLGGTMRTIHALLSDAGSKQSNLQTVEEVWLQNLRAVSAEADNLLDEIAYEALRRKVEKGKRPSKTTCNLFSSSSHSFRLRFKVAKQIKHINLALDEVYKEADRIGLRPIEIPTMASTDAIRSPQLTDPFVDTTKIVGRNDFIDEITRALNCSEDAENVLPVIGIVGMAGQGKTTIAQLIYKNQKVMTDFRYRIWVCVSHDFNVERILNDMFQSLSGEKSDLTLREVIVVKLKEKLRGNRFLLVLDDVWNDKSGDSEKWECLYNCLLEIGGSTGSRIIVTTRSDEVISIMRASRHLLGVLPDEESWMLFEKIAFAKGGAEKIPSLEKIGRKIVRKCGGVPLAIKTLGGVMYYKNSEQEWSEIEEDETWRSSKVAEDVHSAIKLSYDHLPSWSLKRCFAFCSVYEEDHVYQREELVQLWMANGFLNPHRESRLEMEQIGNEYFNTLLRRSLFQDAEIDEYGNIECCKMHDLVHGFASQVSQGYCLAMEGGHETNEENNAIHLSIQLKGKLPFCGRMEPIKISKGSFLKLQTFIIHGSIPEKLSLCKYLRALVVVEWGVYKLPCSIEELKHLRYLDIFNTSIRTLPNEITKLYHLQTLRARNLCELPENFADLVNLRHICILRVFSEVAAGEKICWFRAIGKLTSLQTLSYFAVSQDQGCQIEELSNLQNLKGTVRILCLENVGNHDEAVKARLGNKKFIQSLELNWGVSVRERCIDEDVLEGLRPHPNLGALCITGFPGGNLPSWMVKEPLALGNLREIKFEEVDNCKQIPPLGHLRYLRVVKMFSMKSLKCIDNEFYGWNQNASSGVVFQSLEQLEFRDMPNLEEWFGVVHLHPPEFSIFPVLQKLKVSNCPNLRCMADIPNQGSSLQLLKVNSCQTLSQLPEIGNLKSLRQLEIVNCEKLSALPGGIEECTSLEKLSLTLNTVSWMENPQGLTNLRELNLALPENLDTNHFPWPPSCNIPERCPFPYLESLCLGGSSKTESLPQEIMHLPVLRKLRLFSFEGLESLPEWLSNITSLEDLELWSCKKPAHISSIQVIQHIPMLRRFSINNCYNLQSSIARRGDAGRWWDLLDRFDCTICMVNYFGRSPFQYLLDNN